MLNHHTAVLDESGRDGSMTRSSVMFRNPRITKSGMLWQFLAAALLLFAPSLLLVGEQIWRLRPHFVFQGAGIALCYLAAVFLLSTLRIRHDLPRAFLTLMISAALLAAYYLALLLALPDVSRSLLVGGSLLFIFLSLISSVARLRTLLPAWSLAAASLVIISFGEMDKDQPVPLATGPQVQTLHSVLHTVRITSYPGLVPYTSRRAGIRGGLQRMGEDYLAVSGDGAFFLLRWSGDSLSVDKLALQAPLNRGEFLNSAAASGAAVEDALFHVSGLLLQELGDDVRIVVSHHHWMVEQRCFTLRVSSVTLARGDLVHHGADAPWNLLYETNPCLPLKSMSHTFAGHQAGGRLALLGDTALLLTVGDHEFDGIGSPEPYPQMLDNDYGKTVFFSLDGRRAGIFSYGHRNPQGLYVTKNGAIWLTEHGPSGGDELNKIFEGANYGWPSHTYGAQYGDLTWTPPSGTAETSSMRRPVYAWMPGIGISNLIMINSPLFSHWQGDLLVSSLRSNSLYRIRQENGRVVYTESIPVGERIRDLVEGADGRIVLWTDAGTIISLMPATGEEGEVVFRRCAACHSVDGARAIGPDLRGVVGRPVAAQVDYGYSRALRQIGGNWTEDRLDAFLRDPESFAPGTSMVAGAVTDPWVRERLIEYLKARE